jgi:hypothetical protein
MQGSLQGLPIILYFSRNLPEVYGLKNTISVYAANQFDCYDSSTVPYIGLLFHQAYRSLHLTMMMFESLQTIDETHLLMHRGLQQLWNMTPNVVFVGP